MIIDNRKSGRHLSSFHVELLRMGAASTAERAWIERHLQECGRCADMAVAFESHRVEFTRKPAVSAAPIAKVARLWPSRRRRIVAAALSVSLPAAAAFGLFLSARRPAPEAQPMSDVTAKGGAGLTLVARRDGRVFPVDPGFALKAGDQIRFVVDNVRHRYLLVASIDGSGHASIYFPYEGAHSAAVSTGERVELPGSIVTDASPGPERFFALFSADPLETTSVRRALDAVWKKGTGGIRNASKLDVGADEQASVLVEKAIP
jgi:hypothetical protein